MACKIEIRKTIDNSIAEELPYREAVMAKPAADKISKAINRLWGKISRVVQYSGIGGYRVIIPEQNIQEAVDKEYTKQEKAEAELMKDHEFFREPVQAPVEIEEEPVYTKQSLIDKYGEKGKEIFDTLQSISWNLGPEKYKVSSLSTDKILSLINYREEYNDVLEVLEENLNSLFGDIIKRKNINKELNDILDEFGDDVYEALKEKLDDRKKERGESIYGEEKFLKGNLLTTLKSLEEFGFPSDKFNSLLKDAVEFTKTSKKGELNKSLEKLYNLLDSFKRFGEYESIDVVDYYTKKLESEEGVTPQEATQLTIPFEEKGASFKLISQDEYARYPQKYSEEVERVVRLIENKLKIKEKKFVGKTSNEFIKKEDYLADVFKKLLSNIGLPENITSLKELRNQLDNGNIIEYIKSQYDLYKKQANEAKESLENLNANVATLNSYLKVQDLNSYKKEQQDLIKKSFPALFEELGKYKSKKQALEHYKRIVNTPKFLDKVLNSKFIKTKYFTNQAKLNKFENLINYNTLSPEDFNYRIYKVLENELARRSDFFSSPKMQEVVLAEKEKIAKRNYENSVKGILERFSKNENAISGKIAKVFLEHPKTLSAIKSENIQRSIFGIGSGQWTGDGELKVNYKDETSLKHILVHELTHHFTVPYIYTYLKNYSNIEKYTGFIERFPSKKELEENIQYSFESLTDEEIKNISKLEDIYIHVLNLHKEGKLKFTNYNFSANPEYGLENFYEFVSEVISNPYFAAEIAKQPSLYNKKSNLLKDIVSMIFKMFGINNPSLLDDIYLLFEESFLGKDIKYTFKDTAASLTTFPFEEAAEVKPGVPELFDSNPELADAVYEALGFKNKSKERNNAFTETINNVENSKIGEQVSLHKIFPHISDALVTKTKDNKYYIEHTEDLFTKEEFENYLLDRFKPTEKETDVRYIGITPEQKQQALQLYSQYLDTIFPDSKVKDIVYHKTEAYKNNKLNFEKFKRGINNLAYYFTVQPKNLFNDDVVAGKYFPFLLNIKEPLETTEMNINIRTPYNNEDAWIIDKGSKDGWYVVFEPEQIHILGGKQDIEGFKEFVLKNKLSKSDIKFQNKTEATKKNPIEGLNERLISALQSIGVKVEFADSLKNRYSNDPVGTFDSFNKLILIAKNKADVTTLPEEAFHAIVDAFEDHPFIQRLMDLASKTDYKSILGEDYVQLYKGNETKLKKEIIGKWLAAVATNTYQGTERTKSILRQFWDFILSKFGKISDKYQQEFNTELQNALNQVVEITLKGELPTNYSAYVPKDGVFFQTKSSKKSKNTKDKKQNIQSKLLEQEIYFKRRKARLEDWLKKNPQDHPARPARILEYDSVVKALAQYEDLGTGAGFVDTGEIILNNIDNFLRRLETDSLKTYLSKDMDDDLLYTLNTLDVFSRLPSLEGRANKLREKFNQYAIEYTMLQVNKFRNVGEELTWNDVLSQNVDINLYRRYFGALADVQDYLGSTIGVLIKRAQNRASTNNQKLANETSQWAKKLSDWGKTNGKSYDDVMQLFVQIVDDKAILAKPWSTKFYNDLADHANKNDGWYATNAIKTKEGWVPVDKIKYANPQYAYIMKTPVLKEFYNYYQSKLEAFGTVLPRQVNKNMIPNLLKNTLSDIIQSDKSALSKASELVSKVLNIGNYYEDGLIIHDKFKNDIIPLKYFKNITPDKKNLDLVQALYKFGEFANEYDELSDVLPKARLIQRVMSTKQYIKSNDPKSAVSGDETKIFQLADDYIRMQVLGEMKVDEGIKIKVGEIQDNEGKTIGNKTISTSDIVDKFLGYNSLLRIGFNPFNALTNALVGETGNLIEASGGRYYDIGGLNKATQIFATQNFSEKSKMNKILEKFNPLQELTEYSHATNVSKNKLTKEKFMDIMYSPQRAGEKFLQSRTMVAMMFKEKMPDGKNMWEAFDDNGNLKPEYKKNMTDEQYQEFIDRFSDKVQRVNQMIHGRYSQRDAAAAQQWVLMRMIMQFKKWIPAAYESRLGKRQYDPRLRDEVEGRYLTGARILRDALKGDLNRLKAGNMTPLELYNMRKNLMEAVLILATYGLYMMLGWGDDEEKKKSASYKFWIDQADRVSGDLLYWYNPAQMNRTIKSPISLTTTVSDAFGALTELPFVFGENAEYKRGEKKGENKFISKTTGLIPLVKPATDFARLFNNEKYVEYEPR